MTRVLDAVPIVNIHHGHRVEHARRNQPTECHDDPKVSPNVDDIIDIVTDR